MEHCQSPGGGGGGGGGWGISCTAWCSEIGSLQSSDAPELHASSDVREPISLHQAVHTKTVMVSLSDLLCQWSGSLSTTSSAVIVDSRVLF